MNTATIPIRASEVEAPERLELDTPQDVAQAVLDRYYTQAIDGVPLEGVYTLRYHAATFHVWNGRFYIPQSPTDFDGLLSDHLKELFQEDHEAALIEHRALVKEAKELKKTPPKTPKKKPVTAPYMRDVLKNLSGNPEVQIKLTDHKRTVFWCSPDADDPPIDMLAPAINGIIDTRTMRLIDHTPRLFISYGLDFEYRSVDKPIDSWRKFIGEVFPDPDACREFQKMCGYLTTIDNSREKLFSFVGPARAGKGTIQRVLKALIGPDNVGETTLTDFGDDFGMENLLDKPVIFFPDEDCSGKEVNLARAGTRIKQISGNDSVSLNEKHKARRTVKPLPRFVAFSNRVLNLRDPSGVLADRIIPFKLTTSWLGREDYDLKDRLYSELPGIFDWAAAGKRMLEADRKFVIPDSYKDLQRDIRSRVSNISDFCEDCCTSIEPDDRPIHLWAQTIDTFHAWAGWCRERHHKEGNDQSFGTNLKAHLPLIRRERASEKSPDGKRHYHYIGLILNDVGEEYLGRYRRWNQPPILVEDPF